MAEPAAKDSAGAKRSAESNDLRKVPPVGDVVVVAVRRDDCLPAGLARVFPGLLGQQSAIAAEYIGRQDFRMVADLLAGNKVFVAHELHVFLALGAEFDAVGGGAVLVAFVDGADGGFHRGVPLGDEFLFLFGRQVLRVEPGPERCLGGLYCSKRFAGGAYDNGVLA